MPSCGRCAISIIETCGILSNEGEPNVAKCLMPNGDLHQQLHIINDAETGVRGMIAVHSTRLGPAAGGCRLWSYGSARMLEVDALRLARSMSYLHAIAGLPFGGGMAVLQRPEGNFDRAAILRVLGETVKALGGVNITVSDVGTTMADIHAVRGHTKHIAGLGSSSQNVGDGPSQWTSLGIFNAMKVAARLALGSDLRGLTVAVQGLGNVGASLCWRLANAGAKLVIADPNAARTQLLSDSLGAKVISIHAITQVDADIFAPCALGGVLNERTIPRLKVKIVCGSAHNQLADAADAEALLAREITYAPDYVINSGGMIKVAADQRGESVDWVEERMHPIAARLETILKDAAFAGVSPVRVADDMAIQIISKAQYAPA
jgi:leucine dehydrogenase